MDDKFCPSSYCDITDDLLKSPRNLELQSTKTPQIFPKNSDITTTSYPLQTQSPIVYTRNRKTQKQCGVPMQIEQHQESEPSKTIRENFLETTIDNRPGDSELPMNSEETRGESELQPEMEDNNNEKITEATGCDLSWLEALYLEALIHLDVSDHLPSQRVAEVNINRRLATPKHQFYDLVISSVGILSIRGTCDSSMKAPIEDPMVILQKGYSIIIVLVFLTFGAVIHLHAFYYTDYKHKPVRNLALSSSTGHGANIIAGVSLGLESTALPVLVISVSIVSSYWLGQTSRLMDETGSPTGGLFGTAVATMRMLSTAAYVLTMDMFGPIADSAGGIPESVRKITDILDAVGNITKATTKGFTIGSAALASFLLFSAYMDEVATFAQEPFKQVGTSTFNQVAPSMWSMLIFLFNAWACSVVSRTAKEVVNEEYKEKPDYGRCVAIVASASLREMIKPGALAIISPIVVGFLFRILGYYTGQPLLGAKVAAALLMFATVSGTLMALFLNTVGGDTVGDPFKDTAGPSLHVFIKMLASITLVMAPIFL
ncbi:hypothetical protein JRO89_XS09G0033000 [Xanthoceras sorbifolium]|uniref:H(+)-exporting diphosphatase n=1 Tax=Xanthoceras sorbifolium TaxID=99658 RepID=A0ABQ8HKD4_9ROSI|nr:hypothetical protein JRO89_XS09G0033000 [Xanthoceras sorbifolium]